MLVLVNHRELSLGLRKLELGKFLDGLIGEKELDLIPGNQLFAAGGLLAVEGDVLFPHHFIEKTFRRLVEILSQELVQPLTGLRLGHGKLFHAASSLIFYRAMAFKTSTAFSFFRFSSPADSEAAISFTRVSNFR